MIKTWTAAVATAKRMAIYLSDQVAIYDTDRGYLVRPRFDQKPPRDARPHLGRAERLIVGTINGEMCTW